MQSKQQIINFAFSRYKRKKTAKDKQLWCWSICKTKFTSVCSVVFCVQRKKTVWMKMWMGLPQSPVLRGILYPTGSLIWCLYTTQMHGRKIIWFRFSYENNINVWSSKSKISVIYTWKGLLMQLVYTYCTLIWCLFKLHFTVCLQWNTMKERKF